MRYETRDIYDTVVGLDLCLQIGRRVDGYGGAHMTVIPRTPNRKTDMWECLVTPLIRKNR